MFMGFSPGAYGPDLVRLMTDALDGAWDRIETAPTDAELSRLVLAGAIIDEVDAGVREHGRLVAKALEALAAAVRVSGEKLSLKQGATDAPARDG
jgi:hypothetical protein